ncbi:MAG: hypothetical protein QM765_33290 [Myxococcales bacterium]
MPTLELESVVTRRRFDLGRPGRRALVIVHGRTSSEAVAAVMREARQHCPDAGSLLVAAVPDVSLVPRLMRPLALPFLARAYLEAAAKLPEGLDPVEHVVILPDFTGAATRALGLRSVGERAAVALIGADGEVLGVEQGGDPVGAARRLLSSVA